MCIRDRAISLADSSITDVSTQLTLLRYIRPTTNQTNTYCIATGGALYDSNPSNNDGTTCKKEPILLSGTFRTSDRPGVDQQFEDDGFGNLRTFYNTGNRKVYTNNAAGTVNYSTGEVCFGPVAIIGAGVNIPVNGITITDTTTGAGSVSNADLLPTGLSIPVLFIPANVSTIPASTPGTIINIVNPEVTIVSVGTVPPPTIPLNSLTPAVFNNTPTTLTVADIANSGNLTNTSCF